MEEISHANIKLVIDIVGIYSVKVMSATAQGISIREKY